VNISALAASPAGSAGVRTGLQLAPGPPGREN